MISYIEPINDDPTIGYQFEITALVGDEYNRFSYAIVQIFPNDDLAIKADADFPKEILDVVEYVRKTLPHRYNKAFVDYLFEKYAIEINEQIKKI